MLTCTYVQHNVLRTRKCVHVSESKSAYHVYCNRRICAFEKQTNYTLACITAHYIFIVILFAFCFPSPPPADGGNAVNRRASLVAVRIEPNGITRFWSLNEIFFFSYELRSSSNRARSDDFRARYTQWQRLRNVPDRFCVTTGKTCYTGNSRTYGNLSEKYR